MNRFRIWLFIAGILVTGCSSRPRFTDNPVYWHYSQPGPSAGFHVGQSWNGTASFYGAEFDGKKTASGEPFDMKKMTAAHMSLPFGTILDVENISSGKHCQVRINDRGPLHPGRMLDLSYGAARNLGLVPEGTAEVKVTILILGEE